MSSFETVWSAPPRLTSKNSVSPFLEALAVGTFARRVEGTSLSQERIQLGLGGAVSPFPGRPFGTPYRRKFDKLWTMLNYLREGWKHSICWSNSNTSVDSYQKSVPHQSINQCEIPRCSWHMWNVKILLTYVKCQDALDICEMSKYSWHMWNVKMLLYMLSNVKWK